MESEWQELRRQLNAVIRRGERSQAARQIGISVGYFHDLLDGKKHNPGEALRGLFAAYLQRPEVLAKETVDSVQSGPARSGRRADNHADGALRKELLGVVSIPVGREPTAREAIIGLASLLTEPEALQIQRDIEGLFARVLSQRKMASGAKA